MMYSDGAIIAQVQNILTEQYAISVMRYQQLERGDYWSVHGIYRIESYHEGAQEIDMVCDAEIAIKTGNLMQAVRQYKICPTCGGLRSYAGLNGYEWCYHCNCFGEVPA